MHTSSNASKPYGFRFFKGFSNVPYGTSSTDPINIDIAIHKRINPLMSVPSDNVLHDFDLFVIDFLQNSVDTNGNLNFPILPYIEDDYENYFLKWIESRPYSTNRKKQLKSRFYQNYHHGEFYHLTENDYKCTSFVKREFYKTPKCARFINSRSDNFKCVAGPVISMIDEIFSKLHWSTKHIDPIHMQPLYERFQPFTTFVQTDYSSFESGFNYKYTCCAEQNLWEHMLQNNPQLLSIIQRVYTVNGKPRIERCQTKNKSFQFETSGTRMSGEMWTSLANGFSNLCNMLFICQRKGLVCDGIIEGDDGLFGISGNNLIDNHDFEQLGFKIVINYEHDLTKLDFCSLTYNPTTGNFLLDPEHIIRLPWTCHTQYIDSRPKIKNMLLNVKTMSTAVRGHHTPILAQLCETVLRLNKPAVRMKIPKTDSWKWARYAVDEYYHNKTFVKTPIDFNDRLLYAKKFGISIEVQEEIELILKKCTDLDQIDFDYYLYPESLDRNLCY